jgi:putative PIN family toxin of toxin-antitoxin system
MTITLPRVVYDCNVYIQAIISPNGPSGHCLQRFRNGEVQLFISAFLLIEIRESVLKISPRYRINIDHAEALIAGLALAATIVADVPPRWSYDRDPDDAHYVNLALATHARLIVSRDKDLLDLMKPDLPEAADFQHQFPTLRILDPVQFLRELDAAQ